MKALHRTRRIALAAVVALLAPGSAAAQHVLPDAACLTELQSVKRIASAASVDSAELSRAKRGLAMCALKMDDERRGKAERDAAVTGAYLSDVFMSIPEYHDEGRLPTGGGALGPMAYVFASPMLGTFTHKWQIFEHQEPGKAPGPLAAIVQVYRDDVGGTSPIPGTYSNLLLDYGVNCVWLAAETPRPNSDYLAFVSPAVTIPASATSAESYRCDASVPMRSGRLEVHEEKDSRFQDSESYPGAARFDVDRNGQPTIGFKCLNAYCEAMPRRVTWKESRVTPNPRNASDPKSKTIKGWHDEQELAERTSAGLWRSSGVLASIVPEAKIAEYDSTAFHDTWLPLATIRIQGSLTSGKYYDWGLRTGDRNFIYAKFVTATKKWEFGLFQTGGGPKRSSDVPFRPWAFRERMIHRDAGVPATARFRFTVGDDGIWVPCGNACCRADGET